MDPSSLRHRAGEGGGGRGDPTPPPRGGDGGGAPNNTSLLTRVLLYVIVFYAIVTYWMEGGNVVRKGPMNSNDNTNAVKNIGGGVEPESLMEGGRSAAGIIGSLDVKEGKSHATSSLMEVVDADGFPVLNSKGYESSDGAFDAVVELDTPKAASGIQSLKDEGFERVEDVLDATVSMERIEGFTHHNILVQYCMS